MLGLACSSGERPTESATTPAAIAAAPRLGTAREALVSTTTLQVSGDTYLQSGSPNQNLGGDTRLSLQSSGKHRSLLFFNPAGITAAVGSGTLVSAHLELSLSTTGTNWGTAGRSIAIHRLKQASAEYQATWNCALDANVNNQQDDCSGAGAWSMNASDSGQQPWLSPATATALITSGLTGVVSFDVTSDVAALLAGSFAGHGWLIKKVEEGQNGSLEFASREVGTGPRLVLQIDGAPGGGGGGPGPVTGSATLPASSDTQVREGQPNQNFGADPLLRIQASGRNRALVDFEAAAVSSALGGPLVRARLKLPIAETADNWGADRAVGAHRLRRGWSESGATWNCGVDSNPSNSSADCSGTSAWTMFGAGAEVPWVDPPTGTALVSNGQTGTLELDVTRDVACALAGFTALDGWIVKKELESQNGKIEFRSRETATPPNLLLEWSSTTGVVVSAADCNATQPPPNGCTPTAPIDTTCNGVDDDCDGQVDEEFPVAPTSCDVGACAAEGVTSCLSGQIVDSCLPGAPAPNDSVCNLIDDDCNGVVDEDYIGVPTSCGSGACSAQGLTECVLGQALDGCQPDTPAPSDATCDGVDDDCDGSNDEDYVALPTSCGVGACVATGTTSCVTGQEHDSCAPAAAAAADTHCDGVDEDCDGSSDEEFMASCVGSSWQTCENGSLHASDCSDGNLCNGQESCTASGLCQAGVVPTVDDGNPCTADACDALSGVSHTPVTAGTSCSDGNLCNGGEVCSATGSCQAGTAPPVDDGNPCTADSCDPATGVAHSPLAAGASCADADLCNGAEACDGSGSCSPGQPVSIDDQNPCTLDSCDPVTGVSHDTVAAGTSCSDGIFCNGAEACNASAACESGLPVDIDDANPCTVDHCSDAQGVTHVLVPGGTACEDGNVCNGTETCDSSGSCVAGTPLATGSENPCVSETTCDPTAGLEVSFEPLGTECAPEFICDGAGHCLRDQGDGTPVPPLPPSAAVGISVYGPALPRDPVGGCTLEPIGPDHVAVVVGAVKTWDPELGQQVPVPHARVSIPQHCEFGVTWTLADGTFRYPINGGGSQLIRIEADADGNGTFDYLPAERLVESRWRATAGIDDVELVLPAAASETLDLVDGAVPQGIVVNGPVTQDDRGGDGALTARTPSVLFKAGTVITGVDANGASVALDSATIRMTEYTVGEHGRERMPAPLPPGTAYGYAAEFSIDGVDAAFFDQPAVFYVDNFLGAEAAQSGAVSSTHRVGLPVPAWYYDRQQGAWIQEEDGIIIRLVGLDGGSPPRALIDADNDGDADQADVTYLAARSFVIDVAERELLAQELLAGRRSVNSELWRIELQHFSTFDWNWFLRCASCTAGKLLAQAVLGGPAGPANCQEGSMVNVESMSVAESFEVAGTPFSLNYSSRAVYGYKPRREQQVDRSLPPVQPPLSIAGIRETLFMANKRMNAAGCVPTANGITCHPEDGFFVKPTSILWDGRDADGRIAYGTHRGGWGVTTTVVAQTATASFSRDFPKGLPLQMTVYDAKILGLGGWTLSPHHFHDAEGSLLFRGDGGESTAVVELIERVRDVPFGSPNLGTAGIRVERDGTVFLASSSAVFRINLQNQVETWRTGGEYAFAPDGPERLFVGNAFVQTPSTLRRLELVNGVVQQTASVNTSARLGALAVGPDSLVYAIVETNPISVHRYTQGLQHADKGAAYFTLPGQASAASSTAMSFFGDTLYLAVGNAGGIFRFSPGDDNPTRIANSGGNLVEGQAALSAPSNNNTDYNGVRGTSEGVLFAKNDKRIWLIDNAGILRVVAGDPAAADGSGDGGPALLAGLGSNVSFDLSPDGSLLLYTPQATPGLRRIRPPGPNGFGSPQHSVPSEDGAFLYDFDSSGHHLRTRNVLTNKVAVSFEYSGGLLSAIVEGDSQSPAGPSLPRTRILRDADGVTIQAPSGQETKLFVSPVTGYATSIVDPEGTVVSLTHDADGLLHEMKDQRGFVHAYGYDDMGRLVSDTSPGLSPQTLSGQPLATVAHTNGENEQSEYQVSLNQQTRALTRSVHHSDGSSVTSTVDKRLQRVESLSDGTTINETFIKHPTFATSAPILGSRSTRLPSGTTRTESHGLALASGVWTESFGLNGNLSTTRTNQALSTVTTTTAQGRTLTTTLDAQGRPTQVRVGNLEPTLLSYDTQGRPLLVSSGSGASARATRMAYYPDHTGEPASGHLLSLTDALNRTVDFTRDAFGRPLSVTSGNDTTYLSYTATGQLEQLTTANLDTHFQLFSGVNLLTEYVAPGVPDTDDLTEYGYDNARRPTTTTLPGAISLVQLRDGLDPAHPERKGRLRAISSPNSGNGTSPVLVNYTYADEVVCADPNVPSTCPPSGPPGQLSTLRRGDISTRLTFDGFVPMKETHTIQPGSTTGLVNTEYAITLDNNFQAQAENVTVGANTFSARYSYDNDAVLTCAGFGASCAASNGVVYRFDSGPGDAQASGHGLLEGTTSNTVVEAFTYNGFGELATQVVSISGSPALTTTYHSAASPRDALGRITTKTVTRGSQTQAVSYGYDAKGQLLTVAPDGEPSRTNVYDPNGNRLCTFEAPATGCDEPAVFDAQDRLVSGNGVEYLYTDRGSLFQRDDGSTLDTFTYDVLGNLTRVERDGGPTIDYLIDAQGRRVGKQVDGTLQRQYVWSGALRIAAELNASGAVTRRFIYGNKPNVPDLIVQPDPGGTKLYRVITDHLGSPVYVVNISNANDVLLDATYDEWGQVTAFTSSTGVWPIPFGFAGGLYDADTGLVRFGARDYDPRIGRWTSKDPIRWEGGQANLYVYATSNPLNLSDPEGTVVPLVAGLCVFGGCEALGAAALSAAVWTTATLGAIWAGIELGTVLSVNSKEKAQLKELSGKLKIPVRDLSKSLHKIKDAAGIPGPTVTIDDDGTVRDPVSGEDIGNICDG